MTVICTHGKVVRYAIMCMNGIREIQDLEPISGNDPININLPIFCICYIYMMRL